MSRHQSVLITGASSGMAPSVIADVIVKAIDADKPKTRYAAGYLAKPLLFFRWLLPDRLFDRLIMSQVK